MVKLDSKLSQANICRIRNYIGYFKRMCQDQSRADTLFRNASKMEATISKLYHIGICFRASTVICVIDILLDASLRQPSPASHQPAVNSSGDDAMTALMLANDAALLSGRNAVARRGRRAAAGHRRCDIARRGRRTAAGHR